MPVTPDGYAVPTKNPNHLAVIKEINVMLASARAIDELREDARKWEAEVKLAEGTGNVRNAKVVSAIATKRTMLGMLPAALRREEGIANGALARGNEHIPALQTAGFEILASIESELAETIAASLGIYVEEDEHFDEVVSHVCCRTPFGRRLLELRTERTYPPARSVGELNHQACWFSRVTDLQLDREKRKWTASRPTVPTAESATISSIHSLMSKKTSCGDYDNLKAALSHNVTLKGQPEHQHHALCDCPPAYDAAFSRFVADVDAFRPVMVDAYARWAETFFGTSEAGRKLAADAFRESETGKALAGLMEPPSANCAVARGHVLLGKISDLERLRAIVASVESKA